MLHDEARQANQRLGELAQLQRLVVPAEAGLHHHLLAVMRPPLHERRRRKHDRLPHLRLHLAQVLKVQEVPGNTSWIEIDHSVG